MKKTILIVDDSVVGYLLEDALDEEYHVVGASTLQEDRLSHKPYAKSNYQAIWQSACKQVGVKIKSYEGLRHSFASQRVSRGIDIYLISKVLSHTEIRTTQRYSHTNLASLKPIMSINYFLYRSSF